MTAHPNLPSQYDPSSSEAKWQQAWEDNQVFKADPSKPGEPYCVVIPPPNVTGSLHMDHALQHTVATGVLGVLLGHLLKWQFQSKRRSSSWLGTIREQ